MMINRLNTNDNDFDTSLSELLAMPEQDKAEIEAVVKDIIAEVRVRGDDALLELTNKFDRTRLQQASSLEVDRETMRAALSRIDPLVLEALKTSIDRVRIYHQKQLENLGSGDWQYEDSLGNQLGQRVRSMQRVGIYVPGGKASYPSSLVMTAVPAKVAGVKEVILTVPTPEGEVSDVLLAAASLCDVDRMFTVGGAQAIAALAFGTEMVPKVDKIVGPGNIYVATAKALLFGQVGIDMIAGPSEVLIVADDSAEAEWLAMDMFAQAEHDEMAQSILISPSQQLLDDVFECMRQMLPTMPRQQIIEQSLKDRGGLIRVNSLVEAAQIVNRIAPEHLEIAVSDPENLLAQVNHAGAIFIGNHSAEVVGDYTAGPSHVLPTGGTARFASPLGVYDFQVRSSVIQCSQRGAVHLSRAAAILAEEEGLQAHAESAKFRVQG